MEPVSHPYPGYRLRARYTRLISKNPANAGHMFRDANGRPSGAILATLYLGPGHRDYIDGNILLFYFNNNLIYMILAERKCQEQQEYPGQFRPNPTTFNERYIE